MKKTSTRRKFRSVNEILVIIAEAVIFLLNLHSDLTGWVIEIVELPVILDFLPSVNFLT